MPRWSKLKTIKNIIFELILFRNRFTLPFNSGRFDICIANHVECRGLSGGNPNSKSVPTERRKALTVSAITLQNTKKNRRQKSCCFSDAKLNVSSHGLWLIIRVYLCMLVEPKINRRERQHFSGFFSSSFFISAADLSHRNLENFEFIPAWKASVCILFLSREHLNIQLYKVTYFMIWQKRDENEHFFILCHSWCKWHCKYVFYCCCAVYIFLSRYLFSQRQI